MIDELKDILKSEQFRLWLKNPEIWETLDVDYHPPRVERVWMQYNDRRISLHVIHPCDEGEALLHPHPWKSAIYILPMGGRYEHVIGYKDWEAITDEEVIISTQEYKGDVYYEMLNNVGLHSVRPIGLPIYSIMISGPVIWSDNKTKETKEKKKLEPLSEDRKQEILDTFKFYFE